MRPDKVDMIEEFEKIYDQYSDKIFRHLYFRVNRREKALDLMQETFMKTFLYLKKGQKVENMQAFLYRVANNLCIDSAKKQPTLSLEELEENRSFTPSINDISEIQNKLDADEVLSKIKRIPARYQTIIIMRYVDELSPKEMAQALGETENAIRVKTFRALHQLRNLYKKYE